MIELAVAILVLGVFMTMSMKLFRSTMDVITSRPRHDAAARQLDRVIQMLRADAWGALEMRLADAHTLVIHPTGDHALIWKLPAETPGTPGNSDNVGHIQRGVYLDEQQTDRTDWQLSGGGVDSRDMLRFEADGSILTLTWTDAAGRTQSWPLYSQLRLLIRGGS